MRLVIFARGAALEQLNGAGELIQAEVQNLIDFLQQTAAPRDGSSSKFTAANGVTYSIELEK